MWDLPEPGSDHVPRSGRRILYPGPPGKPLGLEPLDRGSYGTVFFLLIGPFLREENMKVHVLQNPEVSDLPQQMLLLVYLLGGEERNVALCLHESGLTRTQRCRWRTRLSPWRERCCPPLHSPLLRMFSLLPHKVARQKPACIFIWTQNVLLSKDTIGHQT